MKLLLGITSSIAAYRMPNIISMLRKKDIEIKTIVTERAKSFTAPQALAVMSKNPCLSDEDEWNFNHNVLHIELAKWCDAMLIAPLTANSLAKISSGLCDNLLTSTVRALADTPLLLAPAMNTRMWENPLTETQLELCNKYYRTTIIQPIVKHLADGDSGMGALAEDDTIVKAVLSLL
jgi:phosphopantothenoylcysteine synthetase/decarboxylase